MKKQLLIFLMLSCVVLCCGCQNGLNPNESTINFTDSAGIIYSDYNNHHTEYGNLCGDTELETVHLISEKQDSVSIQTDVYLTVDTECESKVCLLGKWDKMVLNSGSIQLYDFDKDGYDEIIVHMEVTGNGATVTQMFKVVENDIVMLDSLEQKEFGFSSSFIEDYRLMIKNDVLGYEYTMDIEDMYSSELFDGSGEAVSNEEITLGPIHSCEIDENESELHCIQYVQLFNDTIGEMHTIFTYDTQTETLKPVKVEFVECKNINDLITEIYSDEQLDNIRISDSDITQLNTEYPIECLRKTESAYQAVYRGEQKILIVTFNLDGVKEVSDIYNMSEPSSFFDSISIGSTLDEVQEIDVLGDYTFLHTGRNDTPRISYHYMSDGYVIQVTYDDDNIVTDIKKEDDLISLA